MKNQITTKKILIAVLIFVLSPLSYGLTTNLPSKTFNFKYELNGQVYTNTYKVASEDTAIEIGAMDCFNHFTQSKGQTSKVEMEEDQALDLIDVCSNPKKI